MLTLLSVNINDLQNTIEDLEKLSLVNLVYNKEEIGIKIHRLVQDHINHCFSNSNLTSDKRSLVDNLLELFADITPSIDNPNKKWDVDERLYTNIEQLIQHDNETANLHALAKVYSKLAKYQKLVTYRYGQILKCNQKALEYYMKALEIRQNIHREDHPDLASSLHDVGVGFSNMYNCNQALNYKQQSLRMRQKLYKDDHEDIVQSLKGVAVEYNKLGNYVTAIYHYKCALRMKQSLNQNYDDCLSAISAGYFNLKRYEQSLSYAKQAWFIRKKQLSEDKFAVAMMLNSIKHICGALRTEYKNKYTYKSKYYKEVPNLLDNKFEDQQIIIRSYDNKVDEGLVLKVDEESVLKQPEIYKNLDGIANAASKGNWSSGYFIGKATSLLGDWGVKGYTDITQLKKLLGEANNKKNVEILKMLCFEAICLGIWFQSPEQKNYKCLDEFVEIYPNIADKVLKSHPEYFIDKSILSYCKKYVDDKEAFSKLMQFNSSIEQKEIEGKQEQSENSTDDNIANNLEESNPPYKFESQLDTDCTSIGESSYC